MNTTHIQILRPTVTPPPRSAQPRAGAGKQRLPFIEAVPLAGWGPFMTMHERLALEELDPLQARALVLDDAQGGRVALVTVDLHGGTRYLTEAAAAKLADLGLHAGNLLVCGTHNHAGPAGLNASPYYDAFAASTRIFDLGGAHRVGFIRALADAIADCIASAVRQAVASLTDAVVGVGEGRLLDWSVNRSVAAFLANFQDQSGVIHGLGAQLAAANLATDTAEPDRPYWRQAVDPSIPVLAARASADGRLIGCFAIRSAHNVLLSRVHCAQSADHFGAAARLAEQRLNAVVLLAAGAIGDSDPRAPGQSLEALKALRGSDSAAALAANRQEIERHGQALAGAIAAAVPAPSDCAPLESVGARFLEDTIAGAFVDGVQVASTPRIGVSTLAGSELGTGDIRIGLLLLRWFEGLAVKVDESDPHSPKPTSVPFGSEDLLTSIGGGAALGTANEALVPQHRALPLRLVELALTTQGQKKLVRLLGTPGEPTTWFAAGLKRLLSERGATHTWVTAVTGDYCGYLTTAREYCKQHYEGSSTIWGRHTERWVRARVSDLLSGKGQGVATGSAGFDVVLETQPITLSPGRFGNPNP